MNYFADIQHKVNTFLMTKRKEIGHCLFFENANTTQMKHFSFTISADSPN